MSAESVGIAEVAVTPATRAPVAPPPARPAESLSPFIDWKGEDAGLEPLLAQQAPSLLRELLTAPEAINARLLGGEATLLVQSSLLLLVAASGLSGALVAIPLESSIVRTALLVPLSLLVAMVAALGPIAAVSIVVGVRVPWARLSATLVSAMAAGALATCAVTPFSVVLHRLDAEWAGPLSVLAAFVLAAVVAGRRTRQLLLLLAGVGEGPQRERVALLARVATLLVGFTTVLAAWSFGALR